MIDDNMVFSLWLDFIERDFLKEKFVELVERRVINGATSNPSIFAQAIITSPAYRKELKQLHGKTPKEKYEVLAIEDIKNAAIALRGVYDEGSEGYISIEVDPFLAEDTQATVEEGHRLFKTIDEPNVMIKVPATEAGYEAMRLLLSDGIPVNATLVFSPEQARRCLDAMKRGIDEFENTGGERVEAVVSVFVSRFDRMLDATLASKGLPTARTGIMNAAKVYNLVQANETPCVRTLFASTGVKSEELPVDYYIRELYGPHCVNTAPLHTIEAFEAGAAAQPTLPIPEKEIEEYFNLLKTHGIEMERVYGQLLSEGLHAFEKAFSEMLEGLKDDEG